MVVGASLTLGACGQGDSGNVMGASQNALSPEQVDAALGPELSDDANALPPEANAAEAEEVAVDVEESAAQPETRNPAPEQEPGPEPQTNDVEQPE